MNRRGTTIRNGRHPALRLGLSLIEIMVVITLTSMLVGLVATYMATLLRLGNSTREQSVHRMQVERLTDSIRHDLRRAIGVTQSSDKVLEVQLPDGVAWRYVLENGRCTRSQPTDNGQENAKQVYTVGPTKGWRLEETTHQPGRIVSLWIDPAATIGHQSPRPPIWIVGQLGEATR